MKVPMVIMALDFYLSRSCSSSPCPRPSEDDRQDMTLVILIITVIYYQRHYFYYHHTLDMSPMLENDNDIQNQLQFKIWNCLNLDHRTCLFVLLFFLLLYLIAFKKNGATSSARLESAMLRWRFCSSALKVTMIIAWYNHNGHNDQCLIMAYIKW